NLHRLSDTDPDEMAVVYNTLATIENLIEVKPAVAEIVYASEIPAILLQNSSENQKKLGQMNGIDFLLRAVYMAMYKSKDPKNSDEAEMLDNLFDCFCCLLMILENKERFVKAEGVELMIIFLKQKKSAYG
ncbi:Armadillo-type fold containing protein, partial [Trema orientale]